jgi:hypothetical protein
MGGGTIIKALDFFIIKLYLGFFSKIITKYYRNI